MDSTNDLRNKLTAGALVLAPVLMIIGDLLHPKDDPDAADQFAIVRDNLDSWFTSHMILLIGVLLLIGAFLGFARWLRGSAPALSLWASILGVMGLAAVMGIIAVDGFLLWEMAQPERDAGQMTALWDGAQTGASLTIFFVMSLGFMIGLLLLGIGVLKSRAAPQWVGAVLIAAAVAAFVSRPIGLKVGVLLSEALMLAAFAWLAARLFSGDGASSSHDSAKANAA